MEFEVIEKRINETNEVINENICSEEKEKHKYLFDIQKNLQINGGNYDYVKNKFIKKSNKRLNIDNEVKEICDNDKDSRDALFEERLKNLRINSNNILVMIKI